MATLLIVIPITFFINENVCPGGISIDASHQSFNKWIGFLVFIGLIGAATITLLAVIRGDCEDAKNNASDWLFGISITITALVIIYIITNVMLHARTKGGKAQIPIQIPISRNLSSSSGFKFGS
jgi:hypothetical protein